MFLKQFIHFMTVGLSGTAVEYSGLWAGVGFEFAPDAASSAVGYLLGSMLNYLLNYFFTFGSEKTLPAAEVKFYTQKGLGWALNAIVDGVAGWNVWLAKVFATGVCLAWSFSGGK